MFSKVHQLKVDTMPEVLFVFRRFDRIDVLAISL